MENLTAICKGSVGAVRAGAVRVLVLLVLPRATRALPRATRALPGQALPTEALPPEVVDASAVAVVTLHRLAVSADGALAIVVDSVAFANL